jgi:hypothetical protein
VDTGDPWRGAALLEKARELDRGDPRYLIDLARAYLRRGDVAAAERLLRWGIGHTPQTASGDIRALLVAAVGGPSDGFFFLGSVVGNYH